MTPSWFAPPRLGGEAERFVSFWDDVCNSSLPVSGGFFKRLERVLPKCEYT